MYNYTQEDISFIELIEDVNFHTENFYGSFEDYLILPTFLEKEISRKHTNIMQEIIDIKGSKRLAKPVISSPMSFFGKRFGERLVERNFIYSIPRINKPIEERIEIYKELKSKYSSPIILSIGAKERITNEIIDNSDILLLDIAHGASKHSVNFLYSLSNLGINSGVMVGNIGSINGMLYLLYFAAKFGFKNIYIRSGIGSGSACTTRLNTGVGFPQLDLMRDLRNFLRNLNSSKLGRYIENLSNISVYLVSDGGIKNYGDIAKALIFSDLVMGGKIFASREVDTFDNEKVFYYGMASQYAKQNKENVEGDGFEIKNPPNVEEILSAIEDGLKSALTYTNSTNLDEFRKKAKLIRVSSSTLKETYVGF